MANNTPIKVICITCPKGCTLEVLKNGETITEVKGGCKRGHDYVRQELTDPRRMVASSVCIEGGIHPLIPVYTSAPFPKPRIPELLAKLRKARLKAPVRLDQIVIENVLDTGIDIRASRDMPARE